MKRLQVQIEVAGEFRLLGYITYSGSEDACFQYADAYLEENNALPVSLSLPLQREAFDPLRTKIFFEGLLPEGFTRRTVAQWLQVVENDYISLLHGLGHECLGAIRVIDETDEQGSAYEPMSLEAIRTLANEGAEKSTEIILASHLSLAGASSKVGLYRSHTGAWYLPKGIAPSTHIVKQSHVRLKWLVANEQLALLTAQRLGIKVAPSFIVDTGKMQDEDILLASERYDRTFVGAKNYVDGLLCPVRLHQEDFAQALGVGSENKYEKPGDFFLKRMFELLYKNSSRPLEDMEELWKRIIFNYLIGNCDGHIKNNALLYSSNMQSLRLAPAYDIVSTVIYKPIKRNMSLYLAGECNLDAISRDTFGRAAQEVGLGRKRALRLFDEMSAGFATALQESAETLQQSGFAEAETICRDILELGGHG